MESIYAAPIQEMHGSDTFPTGLIAADKKPLSNLYNYYTALRNILVHAWAIALNIVSTLDL